MNRRYYPSPRQREAMAPYRSMFEKYLAENLTKRGIQYGYETEVLSYVVPSSTHQYTPDFIVTTNGGSKIYVEAKGLFTSDDRKKAIQVRLSNPKVDVRFVFMNPKLLINPGAKQNCGQWAERNGFRWADRFVPDEWLQER